MGTHKTEYYAAIKTEDDNYAPIYKVIQNITVYLRIRKIETIKYKTYIIYIYIIVCVCVCVSYCVCTCQTKQILKLLNRKTEAK